MAARNTISIRYYLWADDGPWRLASRLHQDLIARKVALPQYAGTKQKMLEVMANSITSNQVSLKGRGSIGTFDSDGFLEPSGAEELVGLMVDRLTRKLEGGNVVSIEPALRKRSFKREHLWKPTKAMLGLVETDFCKGRLPAGRQRVRVLRAATAL